MPAWPVTLPTWPLVAGYGETFEDRRIVFAVEYGPGRTRPRSTVPVRYFIAPYVLTSAQLTALETFYRVTTKAGELRFDWAYPRALAEPTTLQARISAPPKLEALRYDLWRVTLELDALLSPVPTGLGSLVWPATLPVAPMLAGYDEAFAPLAVHGDLPGGAPIARRRTTAASRPIQALTVLTTAQARTFDGFYESDTVGGSVAFTWDHPVWGVVRSVFADGPSLRAITPTVFELAFAFEVVP